MRAQAALSISKHLASYHSCQDEWWEKKNDRHELDADG